MISSFIRSLIPSIDKNECLSDCQITIEELKDTVLPAYKAAEAVFKGYNFKSEEYEQWQTFYNAHPYGGKKKLVTAINEAIGNVIENMLVVEKLIHEYFSDDTIAIGMTARKANIVRALEAGSFFSKYSRKWLINLYVIESRKASSVDGLPVATDDGLSQAEVKWLTDNFVNFIIVLNALSEQPSKVHDRIVKIPDIIISEENEKTSMAQFGQKAFDPLSLGFIPVFMNPIYHVRMVIAEWQTKRYKVAKEELKVIQLRKMNLEKILAQKPDARIQKEIEYYEELIRKTSYDIAQMEKKYAR